MRQLTLRFWRREGGATAVKYALIAFVALVAIALVAGARSLGLQIGATFNSTKSTPLDHVAARAKCCPDPLWDRHWPR
jgi:Flp pilus assembly pilin Flp